MYTETTEKEYNGNKGKLVIQFDLEGTTVTGQVLYNIKGPAGWNFKLKSVLTGKYEPGLNLLTMTSSPVDGRYEGVLHTSHVEITAHKTDTGFTGKKIIIVDDRKEELEFKV